MTPESLLLIDHPFDGAVVLTLNRPAAMNALSRALREQLALAFRSLSREASVRGVVLTGSGKAFCAGLDLKELGATPGTADLGDDAGLIDAMHSFRGPIIAAINGAAVTGGFELALACDCLIASTSARFADTHARVGVMPGWGLSQKLSRRVGLARAKELSLTGNFIGADRAESWGLVNRVVAPQDLLPQALALARDMLSALPEMLLAYKRVIDSGYATTLDEGMRLELDAARAWARTIEPGQIARRTEAVRERGRDQSGSLP